MPGGLEAEQQIGAGSLRLVRLRLTLALVAMAILPLAVGAPLLATALDGQRATEQARVQRDAATVAGTISTDLDTLQAALAKAASASAVAGLARGDKGALTKARPILDPIAADSASGILDIEVVSTGGVILVRESGTKVETSAGQVSGDPLLDATSSAGQGAVVIGDPSTRADGTTIVGLAAPLAGTTSDAPAAGMLRMDISLSALVGASGGGFAPGTSIALTDAHGRAITTAAAPGDPPGGNTYPASAAVPSHPDWQIRLTSPVTFGSPSLGLFALLGLAVIVLLSIVVFMARQILRPAEQLESSRVRLHDLYQVARVDSLRDVITGLGNHRAFQEEADRQIDASRRYGAPLAVVMINLDDFKAINDRLGHEGGDNVLAQFGDLIQGTMRSPDRAFRTGADGFAVLLPHTDADGG